MATLGYVKASLPESNSITMYLKRIDLLITTNEVEEDRKSAVLLCFIGKSVYAALRDLSIFGDNDRLDPSDIALRTYTGENLVVLEQLMLMLTTKVKSQHYRSGRPRCKSDLCQLVLDSFSTLQYPS